VVEPWVEGIWELGTSWASFADLVIDEGAQAAGREARSS